jgi:hypothetical protein
MPTTDRHATTRTASILATAALALASAAYAQRSVPEAAGSLVAVTVEVDGRPVSLYPAPDGSGRFYVEARKGSRYAVDLVNRTADRIGVVLTVDGLNAISGQRDEGIGRMYVLDPWERAAVQGWRTSLQEVRQFNFVDERVSYAARTGQANGKMGWIEVAVYRERHPIVWRPARPFEPNVRDEGRAGNGESDASAGGQDRAAPGAADRAQATKAGPVPYSGYPGTGWGRREDDPVEAQQEDARPGGQDEDASRRQAFDAGEHCRCFPSL